MLYCFGCYHRNGLFRFQCSLNIIVLFFVILTHDDIGTQMTVWTVLLNCKPAMMLIYFFVVFCLDDIHIRWIYPSGIFGFVRLFIKNSNTFECNKDCSSFRCLRLNLNFKSVILTCYIQAVWFTYMIEHIRTTRGKVREIWNNTVTAPYDLVKIKPLKYSLPLYPWLVVVTLFLFFLFCWNLPINFITEIMLIGFILNQFYENLELIFYKWG